MKCELKRSVNFKLQNTVWQTAAKKLIDFPLVNICHIGAVGFYQNLVQFNTIAFITSLYEIN